MHFNISMYGKNEVSYKEEIGLQRGGSMGERTLVRTIRVVGQCGWLGGWKNPVELHTLRRILFLRSLSKGPGKERTEIDQTIANTVEMSRFQRIYISQLISAHLNKWAFHWAWACRAWARLGPGPGLLSAERLVNFVIQKGFGSTTNFINHQDCLPT